MSYGYVGNNISERYKFQWVAPERTGSRKLAEIFGFYGFKYKGVNVFNNGNYHYSHYTDLTQYQDYKIICSTRNPYSRVLSLFKNYYEQYPEKSKENFKKYITEDLPKGMMLKMIENPILNQQPDYVIRLEHMADDLLKLPFIFEVLTEKQVRLLSEHGKPIDEWESYYDQECKDIVYESIPHYFEYFGYQK